MKRFLHIFTSDHANSYLYDRSFSRLTYVHPLLKRIIQMDDNEHRVCRMPDDDLCAALPDFPREEILYYRNKYNHWLSSGLYGGTDEHTVRYSTKINPYDIEKQLANIHQVVFEVTDNCNLNCYYCGYGQLYDFYDRRDCIDLDKEKAFRLLDFLAEYWKSPLNSSVEKEICLSFYGGEPLMNVPLIQSVIEYVKEKNIPGIHFYYSMTTNAILLRKYMDFLVEHDFHLLISLDGNAKNNSYRLFKKGGETFDFVYKNVCLLREKFPDYFKNRVNFNSVLHNRNSVGDIYHFVKNEFGKLPMIGELNTMGVREEAKKSFYKAYRNTVESLHQQEDYAAIEEEMFVMLPDSKNMVYFLHRYTGNVFMDYLSLFQDKKETVILPTGTCFPFSRKLFITTAGKILQCERIAHKYCLGTVDKTGVDLDCQAIADRLNNWYRKIEKQCKNCFRLGSCSQCIFYIDKLEDSPKCPGFATIDVLEKQIGTFLYSLENDPRDYEHITNEIAII